MKSKIMVVDDEMHIRELVRFYLDKAGFDTIEAANAEEALDIVENQYIDLAVVDIMMPGMDGFELVEQMRQYREFPVIMLTAKSQSKDKFRGFSLGIDDYVTKPFSNRELLARVKAHLRRTENIESAVAEENASSSNSEITIGDLKILPDAFVAQKRGEDIELTHREFELLHHLATHMGQVMTREYLLETVWGYDYFGDVRTVDVTIRRLREKIEDTPSRPEYILTRRGVGYYMKSYE